MNTYEVWPRVRLAALTFLFPLVAVSQQAAAQAPDVVVLCEPSMQEPLLAAGRAWRAKTRIPVRVLTASLEQNAQLVVQGARADILIGIGAGRIDKAQRLGALRPGNPITIGHDPVVIVAHGPVPHPSLLGPGDTLDGLLGQGRIGLVDPPFGSAGADARTSLNAVDLWPNLEPRSVGAVTTSELKQLLDDGSVRLAALYKTDLAGDPELSVAATFAGLAPTVAAGLAKNAESPHAAEFLTFLAQDGQAILRQTGMEAP